MFPECFTGYNFINNPKLIGEVSDFCTASSLPFVTSQTSKKYLKAIAFADGRGTVEVKKPAKELVASVCKIESFILEVLH